MSPKKEFGPERVNHTITFRLVGIHENEHFPPMNVGGPQQEANEAPGRSHPTTVDGSFPGAT